MRKYKTLRGFIRHVKWVASHEVEFLSGAKELTNEEREQLGTIFAGIDNSLSEFEECKAGAQQ